MTNTSVDILLIGAGLVGTSLITALRGQGFRIGVLEHHLPQVMTKTSTDSRPIALCYGSQVILQSLGLWENLAAQACPIHAVHVSDRGALGRIHFQAQELKVPALGYVLPYDDLQQTLYRHAASQNQVTFIAIEEVLSINCDDAGATVLVKTAQGEQNWRAELLIASDGTHSTARKLLHIEVEEKNNDDVAMTALITLRDAHQNIAYERFTDLGALALLPLPDQKKYRLVWTLAKMHSDILLQWSPAEIINHMQKIFHNRIPAIESFQWSQHYPITTMIAHEKVRPGLILLGNAAQTLYPLAAQGFNLALRDVAVLSEILIEARVAVKSLGDRRVLQTYADWRCEDQQRTANITGYISEIFGLRWPLINRVRGFGLLAADLLLPVKKRLALQMMGLAGRLPKLARGMTLS
jgi:2-octaprenyl-6-methoxyphenol hydroxylase